MSDERTVRNMHHIRRLQLFRFSKFANELMTAVRTLQTRNADMKRQLRKTRVERELQQQVPPPPDLNRLIREGRNRW